MRFGLSIVTALGGAVSFALAAILQQETAQRVSAEKSLSIRILTDLLGRAEWLAGIAFLLAGYGLQALALAYGPVALVQPIIVTELAFAIPLGFLRRNHHAGRREWAGIAAVITGVALFLLFASPTAGTPDASGPDWLTALVPVGACAAGAVAFGGSRQGPTRAMSLGAAAGLLFGILSVVTKTTTYLLGNDVAGAFTHWEPYGAITIGIGALIVSQSAYQAGPLAYSMPFIGVLEPVVAVAIGSTVLNERVDLTGTSLLVEAVAAAVAVAGVVLLTTSKTVLRIYEEPAPAPPEAPRSPHRSGR